MCRVRHVYICVQMVCLCVMGSYVCDICVWCACVYMYACHDVWIYECGMNVVCVWYTYMFVYFVCFYLLRNMWWGPSVLTLATDRKWAALGV